MGFTVPDAPDSVESALAMADVYRLGRIAGISQSESFGNENWLLETQPGQRFVLRRYLHSNLERVQFQLKLVLHLRTHDYPAPEIIETPSGEPLELGEDGVPWVVFLYIEGREYDFRAVDAIAAATRLAEFHSIASSLSDATPHLLHRPSIRECWNNAEADLRGLREMFEGVSVQEELHYLEEWWLCTLKTWPIERLDALPQGLVHGDFHGRNLAYSDGEIVGVFDYDDVERGPYVLDLARSLYKFGRESRFVPRLRAEVVQAFFNEYSRARPLTSEEHRALPLLIAMNYPPNPRYYRYYREHHGTNIEARFRREVGLMRTLTDEVARIGAP